MDFGIKSVQKLENDLLELQRHLEQEQATSRKAVDTSAADVNRIKQINESLQRNHAVEAEEAQRKYDEAYTTLQASTTNEIQGLNRDIESLKKGHADEAARTKDYYERSISQHLRIGIETLSLLREEGDALHSRKLRSFDEPPFR